MAGFSATSLNTASHFTQNVVRAGAKEINPRLWAQQFTREKEIKGQLLAEMPGSIKFLDKMKNFVGEVPNIIINSVGTGLVAPIFIKYNFLSKTDNDTRTYSAWRQPVSAVLAVLTQAGLVIPVNSLINNMCNKGRFTGNEYNTTAYQDLDYLKKVIKKENPNLSKQEIKKLAEARQYKQLEDMIEHLFEHNTIEYTEKGVLKRLKPEQIKSLLTETTEKLLKNEKEGTAEHSELSKIQELLKGNKTLKEIAHDNHDVSKVTYEAVQKHISNIAAGMKSSKQILGLIVSLSILPVTCCLLNYIYPRFMDTFFPNLSSKKQNKQQDRFEKTQAPETTGKEVLK